MTRHYTELSTDPAIKDQSKFHQYCCLSIRLFHLYLIGNQIHAYHWMIVFTCLHNLSDHILTLAFLTTWQVVKQTLT
jgi:hypothetical protein